MVAAADGILSMTSGLDLAHFMASPVLQKAIIHDLMVLGEAAAHVPDDVRAASPDIPWRRLVGMRNKLIHSYFGVDLSVVYAAATTAVPDLRDPLVRLLTALDAD